jgi:DNA-binding XRE family transcriptional regulator
MGDLTHIEGALLDRLPAAVVVSDAARKVVYCNGAARELHGCQVGGPLPAELVLALRSHEPWNGVISLHGHRIHCSATPVRDAARTLVGAITVSLPEGVRQDAELLAIGRRIARARAAARLTQQDLAERLGVTRRSVQGYEAGKVAPYRHLDRLADVLNRPKAWFLLDRRLESDLRRIVREEFGRLH